MVLTLVLLDEATDVVEVVEEVVIVVADGPVDRILAAIVADADAEAEREVPVALDADPAVIVGAPV